MHNKFSKMPAVTALFLLMNTATIGVAGELRTVRYAKEDLAKESKREFIRATDLSDVLATSIKGLAVTVTSRQGGSNVATRDLVVAGAEAPKQLWFKKLSTLTLDPETKQTRGDENRLRTTLASQYRKAAEVNFKNAFPVIERIQKGLIFNLDMKNPAASLPGTNRLPNIRYGLVESEILPSTVRVPVAFNHSLSETDQSYATPAHVIYTIDRLDDSGNDMVFKQSSPEASAPLQNTNLWHKAPSANVNVKIDAADQNAAVSEQISQTSSVPGMRVTLAQADGLITTQFVAGGASSKKSMTTEIKAPTYGEMSIARKFDYKMHPTETSAQNILGESSLPRVNLLYAHATNKIKGEWIVKRDRFEYNVTAEPRQGWATASDSQLGKVGDKVSFGLNTFF